MIMAGCPDLLQRLMEYRHELQTQLNNSLTIDEDVLEFVSNVCESIDSRNILTSAELEEYESIIKEEAYQYDIEELNFDLKEESCQIPINRDWTVESLDNDDDDSIIEELNMADAHIDLVNQLHKNLIMEIEHISSGMHLLQQEKEAAHCNLLEIGQRVDKHYLKAFLSREELFKQLHSLVKLSEDYQNMKSCPHLIAQYPFEEYKKRCCLIDKYLNILMKQHYKKCDSSSGKLEDYFKNLEQSYIEMKQECTYMTSLARGKQEAVRKLKEILNAVQSSKFTLSVNQIRSQSALLEDIVSTCKEMVSVVFENDVCPVIEEDCRMDVAEVKKYKNEYKLFELRGMLRQLDALSTCLNVGFETIELLLLVSVTERQRLIDMTDLLQHCHQEISEECLQVTSRVNFMQHLMEKHKYASTLKNPLAECLYELFQDKHLLNTSADLLCNFKKLNQDVDEEEKLLNAVFIKQEGIVLQNENAIRSAEKFLCSGLTKKPLLQKLEISVCCNNTEYLLDFFEEMLKKIQRKYEEKQMFFSLKPFHLEQRLLWVHFLMDPKTLVAVVRELENRRKRHNESKYLKKRTDVWSFHK